MHKDRYMEYADMYVRAHYNTSTSKYERHSEGEVDNGAELARNLLEVHACHAHVQVPYRGNNSTGSSFGPILWT